MTEPVPIAVLGVGNTIMQDDGIGVRAVHALGEAYDLPSHVRIIEGGVSGLRLLSELQDAGYLLIVDAVEGGGPAGTLYDLSPNDLPKGRGPMMSAHEVGISELLSMAEFLGKLPQTRILGVQPGEARAIGLELTPPLQEAFPRVVAALVNALEALGVEVKPKVDPHLLRSDGEHLNGGRDA